MKYEFVVVALHETYDKDVRTFMCDRFSDRVGGASLFGAPSSHTTVRTVRYTAVPLTYTHLPVIIREKQVAFTAKLLVSDCLAHYGASSCSPAAFTSIGKFPCFLPFDAAFL